MRALIGHTGFVGGALARKHYFDGYFNSKNIDQLPAEHIASVNIAGMPGVRWYANANPAEDAESLRKLITALQKLDIRCRATLYSTIDVEAFPDTPYAIHRRLLEDFASSHFAVCSVVRMPNLFGLGMRKNAIFDLMAKRTKDIHPHDSRQWYSVDQLDIYYPCGLTKICPQPIEMGVLAKVVFDIDLDVPEREPVIYDVKHNGSYTSQIDHILPQIIKFVHETRRQ